MTYATILEDVKDWIDRDDLDTKTPMFIRFAEGKFNQRLRTEKQLGYLDNVSLVGGVTPLPSDFIEFKWLRNTSTGRTLQQVTIEFLKNMPTSADQAQYFAIDNGNLVCSGSATVEGFYYKQIPPIEIALTNWLDNMRHDLYVFEVVSQANYYIKDFESAKLFEQKADAILKEIQSTNNATLISGAPLTARVR
jgi:hypothetical protein